MDNETGSYGTGRDPQRKGGYMIPIVLLLLSSILIHGMTILYVRNQDTAPQEDECDHLLDELPTRGGHYQEPMKDRCGLGLELSDISEIQQRYWSLPDGAFVEQIEQGSTAYAAGLRSGDLLVQIGEHRIPDAASCLEVLEQHCGNSSLQLIYYRDGAEHRVNISLEDTE